MAEKKKAKPRSEQNLRLEPERRLCAQYDSASIKKYRAPSRDDMGFRVLDNCAEENQK